VTQPTQPMPPTVRRVCGSVTCSFAKPLSTSPAASSPAQAPGKNGHALPPPPPASKPLSTHLRPPPPPPPAIALHVTSRGGINQECQLALRACSAECGEWSSAEAGPPAPTTSTQCSPSLSQATGAVPAPLHSQAAAAPAPAATATAVTWARGRHRVAAGCNRVNVRHKATVLTPLPRFAPAVCVARRNIPTE
jgi:hypothetical protein